MPSAAVCAPLRVSLLAVSVLAFGACDGSDQLTNASHDTPDVPVAEPLAAARLLASPAAVLLSANSFRGGIPFGTSAQPTDAFGDLFNGALRNIEPPNLLNELAGIAARGGRVALMFAGNERNYKDVNGHFSLNMWKDRIDRFKDVDFTSYIDDGTIIGHYMIDEPNDPVNWNGEPIPGSTLEEMAGYSKQLWPTMTTIARTWPGYLDNWPVTYRYLNVAWAQYAERFGDPVKFIEDNAAKAKKIGLGLIAGLNISKGSLTKGELTASQIESWGSAILADPYTCAFISWRYDATYQARPDIMAAMASLSEKARLHPEVSCRAGQENPPPPPPAGTTTTITSHGPDPSAPDAPITVSFTVTSSSGTPRGSVQVAETNGATCSGTVASGSCTLTPVGSGTRKITATYQGGLDFTGSSDTQTHTVGQTLPSSTTTSITSDTPDPSVSNQTVTLQFTVSSAGGTPAGTVTVSDGTTSCSATLNEGVGSCSLGLTTTGDRTLTATYPGAAGFSGSSDTESHRVNIPPTAAFTPPTCSVGVPCKFTDSSTDDDGSIASRSWTFEPGVTSTETSPSNTFSLAGAYSVTLTVTDNDNATSSVSHDVTVTRPNTPPVAAFTAPAKCTVGQACKFLDGSRDSDGSIASRSWTFGDGKSSIATDPSNIYAVAGSYTVTLTVTDNGGATGSVSQSVTVAPILPGSTPIVLTVKDLVKATTGWYVRVSWSGASGSTVNLYRDGVLRGSTANDGLARIGVPAKLPATYAFKVCEKVTSRCSNTVITNLK